MTIQLQRRGFLRASARLVAASALTACGFAQGQSRVDTVRLITGYPPGGPLDLIARKVAERLSGRYARVAVVENRTGAAGRIAVETLKAAPADGSALLVTPASILTMYPHVYRQLSYDVFTDLVPVTTVAVTEFALAIGPAVPASVRNFGDFVAWCKANPGTASCGNPGTGSFPHFMAMLLAREAAIPLIHTPFRGGLVAMQAAAGGHIACALTTENSAQALEQAGRVRVIATTSAARSEFFPHAPGFGEHGLKSLVQREWFGAFMPARTPATVVAAASEAIRTVLAERDVRETWQRLALSVNSSTPQELQRSLRVDHDFWGPIIRTSGFTPEA